MAKYESSVKQLYYPQSAVYAKLSDLSNLETIRDRFNDSAVQQQLVASGQVPADKIEQIKEKLQTAQFTTDSVSVNVDMIGEIAINIIDREPEKCIKYQASKSPVPVTLWIQVLPTSDTTSKMRVTLEAELNFFIKQMIGNKLKDGIEKFADMLAMIPYN